MRTHWNTAGLILEGISGVGKSTLLSELVRHPRYVERPFFSSLIFSEHHTQRVLEAKEREQGLLLADSIGLLEGLVETLEGVSGRLDWMDWSERNRVNHRTCYLFERFHLSHVYCYEHVSWPDVQDLDQRLSSLGCKLCLLSIDDGKELNARHRARGDDWLMVLERWGVAERDAATHLLQQQEALVELCGSSALETYIVDMNGKSAGRAVEEVLDFWDIC